jgi:glycosyltransferase involved in cell wall biosynthesis
VQNKSGMRHQSVGGRLKPAPRILFLDHVGVLGGAELGLVDQAAYVGARGHTLLFADGPLREHLEANGSTVTILPTPVGISAIRRSHGIGRLLRSIPHLFGMASAVARAAKPFDLIWANSQKSFVVGCFAAVMSGRPLVWHMHDILSAEHFSRTNRRLTVFLANRFCRKVVVVSEASRRSFIDAGGRSDLTVVIYNGIDPALFVDDRCLERPEYTVGLFGRLTPWKGQDVLIRALVQLPGVHARIVGEALFGEAEYVRSLHQLAEELGVADRCHFDGFRSDIPSAMAECHLIVHTSTSAEPFGRVIVEGMLAGKPVIAATGGATAEILTDGVDGFLVPPGDPIALALAIRRLRDDPALAARIAGAGKATAIERFSLSAFLIQCAEVARASSRSQAGGRLHPLASVVP